MNPTDILCCPLTGDDLALLDAGAADGVRARLSGGDLRHLNGAEASPKFEGFLKNAATDIYYPVRDGIFILLPAFAIADQARRSAYGDRVTHASTLEVMDFYDRLGWTEADSGVFVDADINEDFRDVSSDYIRRCHLRVNDHLPEGGDYILDVASGPIQYEEYLSYSRNFARRICCDVSFEALRLAKAKLGERGVYVQGDITNMPFKTGSIDAFVSLHTIYHVPADDQIKAFRELERVTQPGGAGVVVYSWGEHASAMRAIAWPAKAARGLVAGLRRLAKPFVPAALRARLRGEPLQAQADAAPPVQSASHFCFHAHTYDWYRRSVAPAGWRLHAWRSVSVDAIQSYLPDNALGRALLALTYRLENAFPATLGRIGQYPALVFRKTA